MLQIYKHATDGQILQHGEMRFVSAAIGTQVLRAEAISWFEETDLLEFIEAV